MKIDLLKRLFCMPLPADFDDQIEIVEIASLHSDGFIEADVPSSTTKRGVTSYCGHAIVMRITVKGRLLLMREAREGLPDLLQTHEPEVQSGRCVPAPRRHTLHL